MIHNQNFSYCGECAKRTPHAHEACMFCGFVTVQSRPDVFDEIRRVKTPPPPRRHVEITPKHEPAAVPATREQWSSFLAGLKEVVK